MTMASKKITKNLDVLVLDKKVFLDGHTKKIRDTIGKITTDFMYIAFLLWEVREFQYFEAAGYKSVTEYAEKEFGFSKGTTSKMIKICEEFSARTKSECPSMHLADKYKNFSNSHLMEMLQLPVEKREEIKPDMTIKQIREVRKKLNEVVSTSKLIAKAELKTDKLNELRCENCGESYFVDEEVSAIVFIEIAGKYVAPCCYRAISDIDLLNKKRK